MKLNPVNPDHALKLAQYVLKQADEEWYEKLHFIKFIGNGTFSNVFLAHLFIDKEKQKTVEVAVKHLLNFNSPSRQLTELKYLSKFRGKACIATLFHACQWHGHLLLVLPYLDCIEFDEFIEQPPSTEEVRNYLQNMFEALEAMHKQNVIHRDLKPANFLIGKTGLGNSKRKYLLIDFGLAEDEIPFKRPTTFAKALNSQKVDQSSSKKSHLSPLVNQRRSYLSGQPSKQIKIESPDKRTPKSSTKMARSPKTRRDICDCLGKHKTCNWCHGNLSSRPSLKLNRRAGTAGFRPPEVLMRTNIQTTAIDIWCSGVILLSIITGKFPFFHGRVNDDVALSEITTIFGSKSMRDCSHLLGRSFVSNCGAVRLKLKHLCNALRGFYKNVENAYNQICNANQCYHPDREESRRSSMGISNLNIGHVEAGVTTTDPPSSGIDCSFYHSESSGSLSDFDNGCFVVEPSVGSEPECLVLGSETDRPRIPTELPYPDSLYHLLMELLDINPFTRITAEDALKHPFMQVRASKISEESSKNSEIFESGCQGEFFYD